MIFFPVRHGLVNNVKYSRIFSAISGAINVKYNSYDFYSICRITQYPSSAMYNNTVSWVDGV